MNATQQFLIPFWTAIISGAVARVLIWRMSIRLLNRFREVGANNKEHTVPLKDLEERHSWICNQLITGKVLVSIADGRYYLDEEALIRYRKKQKIIKAIVLVVALSAILVTYSIYALK